MTRISIIRGKDPKEASQQNEGQSHRRTTDKYWMGLFFVLFTIWIIWMVMTSIQCHVHNMHHHTTANHVTTIFHPSRSKINCTFSLPYSLYVKRRTPDEFSILCTMKQFINFLDKILPDKLPSQYIVWGKNWIFDMITCNVAYLDAHYQKSGPIVIWINASFFVGLLVYSIHLIRSSDAAFNWQFATAGRLFFTSTLLSRLVVCFVSHFNCAKLLFFIPEAMLYCIVYMKKLDSEFQIPDYHFRSSSLIWFMYLFVHMFTFLTILGIFIALTYNAGSCSPLFYANVGIVIYCALAIFYFLEMATLLLRRVSFGTVAKHHFGTACYHATLIFPKLRTLLVINEPEFKGTPNTTIIDRLSLLSGKINRMSLLATGATGMNHSEFIRGLLRLPAGCLPTLQPYRNFVSINTAFLTFLLSTNSLILMSFWALGYFDPSVSMKTYAYNLLNFIVHYALITGVDCYLNIAWLYGVEQELTSMNLTQNAKEAFLEFIF